MSQVQEKRTKKESVSQTVKGYILALGKEQDRKEPQNSSNTLGKGQGHQHSHGLCICIEVNHWKQLADLLQDCPLQYDVHSSIVVDPLSDVGSVSFVTGSRDLDAE
jgi:hypothetical protein